jgi:arginine exporter protein ArgO
VNQLLVDLSYLKKQAKTNIKKYIDERLPEEYEKCLVGLTSILREAWTTQNAEDKREKIQALSLAKECYSMKLDLLTNATIVEDVIIFVSSSSNNSKEKPKLFFPMVITIISMNLMITMKMKSLMINKVEKNKSSKQEK